MNEKIKFICDCIVNFCNRHWFDHVSYTIDVTDHYVDFYKNHNYNESKRYSYKALDVENLEEICILATLIMKAYGGLTDYESESYI